MSEESFRAENSLKPEPLPEKKKHRLPQEVKSSTFASTLAVVIVIAAVIIIFFYYIQHQSAEDEKNTALYRVEEQYKNQIGELSAQIKNLEDKDRVNQELIQRDLPDAAKAVAECDQKFEPQYQVFDDKIPFYLNYNNRPFQYYLKQGYQLRQVCLSNDKFLMLLDSQKNFESLTAKKAATADIALASSKIIIGVSDKMFFRMDYFPVKIEDYRFESGSRTYCVFDKFLDSNVLYICFNENKTDYDWYIFDTVKKINHKIKTQQPEKTEVFDEASLELFSKK
ncbi:MAG: hypothetical protein ACOZBH_05680 [Patescibacteria group bacterium]